MCTCHGPAVKCSFSAALTCRQLIGTSGTLAMLSRSSPRSTMRAAGGSQPSSAQAWRGAALISGCSRPWKSTVTKRPMVTRSSLGSASVRCGSGSEVGAGWQAVLYRSNDAGWVGLRLDVMHPSIRAPTPNRTHSTGSCSNSYWPGPMHTSVLTLCLPYEWRPGRSRPALGMAVEEGLGDDDGGDYLCSHDGAQQKFPWCRG